MKKTNFIQLEALQVCAPRCHRNDPTNVVNGQVSLQRSRLQVQGPTRTRAKRAPPPDRCARSARVPLPWGGPWRAKREGTSNASCFSIIGDELSEPKLMKKLSQLKLKKNSASSNWRTTQPIQIEDKTQPAQIEEKLSELKLKKKLSQLKLKTKLSLLNLKKTRPAQSEEII